MPKSEKQAAQEARERNFPPGTSPQHPPLGSSPADPFARDAGVLDEEEAELDRSDYPETLSQSANPAPDEQGFDAVNPRNAVGAPKSRKVTTHHDDGEPVSREQWQSQHPKERGEWQHPILAGRKK